MNRAPFLICEHWSRADRGLIDALSGIPTALIADALGHGFGVMDARIRPVWSGATFIGSALPVQTAPHDILAVHAALQYAQPGDVMVIGTGPSNGAAVVGGVTAGFFRNAGIAAAVTDGFVRDVQEMRSCGVPVYAAGVAPGIPFKRGPGRIGLPTSVGNLAVSAGDIIAGDEDGVVVIPLPAAEIIVSAIRRAAAIDEELASGIAQGYQVPPYVRDRITEMDVRYLSPVVHRPIS